MWCVRHQSSDTGNANQDCASDQTPDQTDLEKCQDCCCLHVHVLVGVLTDTSLMNLSKERLAVPLHSSLRSNDRSPLYRPPIA